MRIVILHVNENQTLKNRVKIDLIYCTLTKITSTSTPDFEVSNRPTFWLLLVPSRRKQSRVKYHLYALNTALKWLTDAQFSLLLSMVVQNGSAD